MTADSDSNPFVGLRPFESDESLLFFGRQEQTMELLQRLHLHHFVAVTGSSGSGKSSLIRAGLIPRLQAGYLVNESDRWAIAVMKPGQTPLFNLAEALLIGLSLPANGLTAATLEEKIKAEGADAVLNVLAPLWKAGSKPFLLVDQFEELFRFSLHGTDFEKKDEAKDFVNILLALAGQKDLPVYIVTTMRSDFIGDCALIYGLPEAMNQSQYIVPRLTRPQLRNAIEGPVRLYKGKINPALTSRLLNDVQLINDELPLLQHALMPTWDFEEVEDRNGELDLDDYQHIGGIENALSNHADEALQGMTPRELDTAKKLFQELTAIDENGRKIRRPVHLSELVLLTGWYKENLLYLIKRFIKDKRSFLVVSKIQNSDDYLIDISHESLIRQWKTLSTWVDEEAEYGRLFLRLTESARLREKKQGDLLSGTELQVMWKWFKEFKPTPVWAKRYRDAAEKTFAFLKDSEAQRLTLQKEAEARQQALQKEKEAQQRQKRRNQRLLFAGLIVVILIISGFAYAVYQNNVENKKQLALNYWSSSQSVREKDDFLSSLHYTAEALGLNKDKDLTKNLLTDIEPFLPQTRLDTILSFPNIILCAAYSPDNKQIAIGSNDGSVRVLDGETGKSVGAVMMHEASVNSVVFSRDGKQLLTASSDDAARLWDVATGKPRITLSHDLLAQYPSLPDMATDFSHLTTVFSATFSPDEKRLLTASLSNDALLWDAATGRQVDSFRHSAAVTAASFSPDGKWILTASADSTFRLRELATRRQILFPVSGGKITAAVFNKEGDHFLTAGTDSTVRVWKVTEMPQTPVAIRTSSGINAAIFSRDGRRILTGDQDGYARFWDATTGRQVGAGLKHAGPVYNVVFRPDGKKILTTSWDKTVRIWTSAVTSKLEDEAKLGPVIKTTDFNTERTEVAMVDLDDTIRIWDVDSKKLKLVIPHGDEVSSAEFSRNSKLLLTACGYGIIRRWDANTGAQKDSFTLSTRHATEAVFSPDGKKILAADGYSNVFVLDAKTLQLIDSFRHSAHVEGIAQSADGKILMIAGSDSTVQLLDAGSKKVLAVFKHQDVVRSAAFSPDGKNIVTASDDFTARLWSIATHQQIGPAMKHDKGVKTVAFSPDGKWIVTTSFDETTRIWDAITLKQIGASITQKDGFNTAVFSPDGTKILMAGKDGSILLRETGGDLDIPPDLFKLQAKALSGTKLNTVTGETECLSVEEWSPLKKAYREKGREHYRKCKYPAFNLWRRFYTTETETIRPGGK